MKKVLLALTAFCLCAAPATAAPYVSGSVGFGILGNSDIKLSDGTTFDNMAEFKSGVPYGGAVGIKSDSYRFEGALGYQSNKVDKWIGIPISGAKVSIFSYMANAYYDFNLKNAGVSPYLMGGIGGASIKATVLDQSKTNSVFAWQLGAGFGIKATDNVTVDFGYRYFKPSNFKVGNSELTTSSSNFLVGLRYEF